MRKCVRFPWLRRVRRVARCGLRGLARGSATLLTHLTGVYPPVIMAPKTRDIFGTVGWTPMREVSAHGNMHRLLLLSTTRDRLRTAPARLNPCVAHQPQEVRRGTLFKKQPERAFDDRALACSLIVCEGAKLIGQSSAQRMRRAHKRRIHTLCRNGGFAVQAYSARVYLSVAPPRRADMIIHHRSIFGHIALHTRTRNLTSIVVTYLLSIGRGNSLRRVGDSSSSEINELARIVSAQATAQSDGATRGHTRTRA